MKNIWLYILVSAGVSYIIRATPLVLIRREIKNRTCAPSSITSLIPPWRL